MLRPYINDGITVLFNEGSAAFAASMDFGATNPVMHNLGAALMTLADFDGN